MSEAGGVKEANKVIGPWDKIKSLEPKNLRPPKSSVLDVTIPVTNVKENESVAANNEEKTRESLSNKILNSKLNVNAAEFIPQSNQNLDNVTINEDIYQNDVMYLRDLLKYLILNPGCYDEVVQPLYEVIEPFSTNEDALQIFISVIIDECILEPNLRYSGARMCSNLIDRFGEKFRGVLLRRCQEEHKAFLEDTYSHDVTFMERTQGFAMLLAELFLQISIGGKSIQPLGQGLLKILHRILLGQTEKGIKSVCQMLKLTGCKLDKITESKPELDELFGRLKNISEFTDLDPNLKFMVTKVLDMRATNWGENSEEDQAQNQPTAVPEPEFANEPVFFGPDGKIITEEETSFLHESVSISEESDESVCDEEAMSDDMKEQYNNFLKTMPSR